MRSANLLRASSATVLLTSIGHGIGHFVGMNTDALPIVERGIVKVMQGYKFDASPFRRSYWDFFVGFSLSYAVLCLMVAILGFQIASAGRSSPELLRGPLVVMTAFCAILSALCVKYLVLPPAIMLGIGAACAFAGLVALPREAR